MTWTQLSYEFTFALGFVVCLVVVTIIQAIEEGTRDAEPS